MTEVDREQAKVAGEFLKKEYAKNARNLKHAMQRGDIAAMLSLQKKQIALSYIMGGEHETERI